MAIVSRIITAAALFSLAFVANAPIGVNAVSVRHAVGRASHHDLIAKAKRQEQPRNIVRRCKPRTSSLVGTASSSTYAPATTSKSVGGGAPATTSVSSVHVTTTTKAAATTTKAAVTTTIKTTSSPPATTSAPSHPGGGKVGLAWSNGEDDSLPNYVTSQVKYIYTWAPNCPAKAASLGLTCGRMLWGYKQLTAFRAVRETAGTTVLMGPNEVNEPTQSYMTPAQGITLWNSEIRPFKKNGMRLVSPSVTSAPSGKTWFTQFFAGCGGNNKCDVDVLSIHWYDVTVEGFKTYMNDFHDTFGIDLWVTEFACQNFNGGAQCSPSFIPQFMDEVTSWMNSVDWIEAYFAFGLLHDMWNVNHGNQLMAADGKPTALGYQFINS